MEKHLLKVAGPWLILPVVLALSCSKDEVTSLNLRYTVVNHGLDVQLDWDQVEEADHYTVSVDDSVIYTTPDNTVLTYTVTAADAGKLITVTAVGADLSESVDFESTVEASSLSNFGEASSAYYSAVGFNQDGQATVYSLTDNGNYSNFDFWISDGQPGVDVGSITLASSDTSYGGAGQFNERGNSFAAWPGGYVAPDTSYYHIYPPDSGGIVNGESYALWLDQMDDGWGLDDHFVRLDCGGIGGDGQVTMETQYQTVGGLRWIPVD